MVQRKQEIGIRMTLGAQQADVLRLVLGQGMRLAVSGVVTGLVGGFLATRLLATLLFGVGAADVPTFVAAAALLLACAFLATLVPARRAARLDPLRSLSA